MRFDSAIFTNLSRDHIDYHGTMEAYGESKARPVPRSATSGTGSSASTPSTASELAERCGAGRDRVVDARPVPNGRPHVFVQGVVAGETGSTSRSSRPGAMRRSTLPLPGDFNVANATEVLALLLLAMTSHSIRCVRRRCRKVACTARDAWSSFASPATDTMPRVYVDYSHTPASIEVALKALRLHCKHGRAVVRIRLRRRPRRGKRPMMGTVAERLADHAIVTSDNPRTEPPEQIIADILEGMQDDVRDHRGSGEGHRLRNPQCGARGHDPDRRQGPRGLPGHRRARRMSFSDYGTARKRSAASRGAASDHDRQHAFQRAADIMRRHPARQRCPVRGVSTDTRSLESGELFVAPAGTQFRRHGIRRGSPVQRRRGAVVTRAVDIDTADRSSSTTRCKALGQLAADWRNRMPATVVGITGSNGKTTLKELTVKLPVDVRGGRWRRRAISTTKSACR